MRPRLRIIHVEALRGWSGGQVQALNLSRGLAERGHNVLIVCPPDAVMRVRAAAAGIECAAVPMRHDLDVLAIARLARIARRVRADVMHLHSSRAHTVGALAARLMRVPAIVAHKRTDFPPGSLLSSWRWGRMIDAAIAVSHQAKASLVRAGVPEQRVHVIHSTVDCRAFAPAEGDRSSLGLPANAPLVAAIGELVRRKGHHVLLEAARIIACVLPDTRYVICGQGPEERALRALAESSVPGAVAFLGQVKDVRPVLAAVDVFVHPALREALGVAVLEAMAMGKAIVASAIGGIPEAIAHGVSGLLVPAGDAKALAEAILRLLRDSELRQAMGRAARKRAETLFSVEAMVTATEDFYYSLLNVRQRRRASS
jgi:glycosyltransferase involved in cell wall biosynthesis